MLCKDIGSDFQLDSTFSCLEYAVLPAICILEWLIPDYVHVYVSTSNSDLVSTTRARKYTITMAITILSFTRRRHLPSAVVSLLQLGGD